VRLALVTQHYAPHFEGGTESVVRAQAQALAELGHEVEIVSGTEERRPAGGTSSACVDGLPVTFLHRTPDESYDLLLERPRLRRALVELCASAELVHVHHWTTLDGALVRSLVAPGRPVVLSLHDHFSSCARFFRTPVAGVERCPEAGDVEPCVRCCAADAPFPAARLRAQLEERRRAFLAEVEAASARVVPSRAHRAALARALGLAEERMQVVPHGLWDPPGRSAPPEAARPLVILHQGHRSSVKGTLDLARAIGALPAELRRAVRLLCLGSELERGFDDALRAAAGDAELVFHPAYEKGELAAALAAQGGAHVAAYPSRASESYGLVVDEALALGLPCLVADSGALPERIGGAGLVLPAGDPAAWTKALLSLLLDPNLIARWRAALPPSPPSARDAARLLDALYHRLRT
jgi:glycosyltransferase involved in cell wall biosynthesis